MRAFDIDKSAAADAEAAAGSNPPLAVLEEDVRVLMKRLGEADFALSEQQKSSQSGAKKLLLALLEIMDSFERVFEAVHGKPDLVTKQMKKWLSNFRTIHRMLRQVLSDQGVTKIENLDQGFDPQWHKVYETVDDSSMEEGTITREVKAGYIWNGVLLRKAEVEVVRHEAAAPVEDSQVSQE